MVSKHDEVEIPDIEIPEQEQEDPNRPIQNFLQKKGTSTSYVYRSGLLDFFDFIMGKRMRGKGATAEELVLYEKVACKYLATKRNHAADVVRYAKHLDDTRVKSKTSHVRLVAVKEFFFKHDIVINDKSKKEIRDAKPKVKVSTNFAYIDRKNLGEILHHGDARFKAFVLTLASSGARLGEALALNWKDIEIPDRGIYPEKPTSVFIRDSKTGDARKVYISRECEQALAEWHKTYDTYREFATKRSKNLKSAAKEKRNGDDRVFPFTETSCYLMWEHALESAGYLSKDNVTKRTRMNIHRLRNFFSVQVASAVGTQVSELLLGHHDKFGNAYSGRSEEELEKCYRTAEPYLTIGIRLPDEKMQGELLELQKRNAELKVKLEALEESYKHALAAQVELTGMQSQNPQVRLAVAAALEALKSQPVPNKTFSD